MKPIGKRIAHGLKWRVNTRLHRLAKKMPPSPFWDKLYHETLFFRAHGRYPKKIRLFNDYLHQMKIDGTLADPLRVCVTDKELSKIFVAGIVGEKYVIPTIAVLRTEQEVDNFDFPETCFIKATNSCGKNIFKKPGDEVNREELKCWLSLSYYIESRELNYRDLHPKVIVEELAFSNVDFDEYQVFCFKGKPKIVSAKFMAKDKVKKVEYRTFFDTHWRKFDFQQGYPAYLGNIPAPRCLEEMLQVSAKLSKYFEFVRVDMFSDGATFLVGEITNCHAGGIRKFTPESAEEDFSKVLFS